MPWMKSGNIRGPSGANGSDGSSGESVIGPAGRDGIDGKSVTLEEVLPLIEKAISSIEIVVKDGADGRDGKDGVGVAGSFIDRNGDWMLTLSDGKVMNQGRVQGRDGVAPQNIRIDPDPENPCLSILSYRTPDEDWKQMEGRISTPGFRYRSIWREGEYRMNDCVTWGGSIFIAQRDTSDKPETSDAWQLAVKRGRDGKDGVVKTPLERAPVKLK